jgi:nucleotide-binding universal stress UspA family protein
LGEDEKAKETGMTNNGNPQRIILAVDLKAKDLKLTKRIWAALQPLLKKGTVVEPVSILNREDAAVANTSKARLRDATELHLSEKLAEFGLKQLAPAKVLFADGSSNQRAVMALLAHATETGCDLIAISSHSRTGAMRFFLGSFAETLSLQSPIPLLVVNPSQRTDSGKSKNILFPTDFSDESKAGLEIVCDTFGKEKRKIVLYHKYESPAPAYVAPLLSYPIPKSVLDENYGRFETTGKQWCKELKDRGIACELIVDRKGGPVPEAILSVAKKQKAQMIAMVAKTGKVGAALLGSVTRQILRGSTVPVWVVHPQ